MLLVIKYIIPYFVNRIWFTIDSRYSCLPLPGSSGAPISSALAESSTRVIFSKNRFIANMAKKCEIHKVYEATVQGILKEKSGVIDKPILKVGNSKKRIIDESGKRAVTEYKVVNYS